MSDAFHFVWSARITTVTTLFLAVFVFLKNRQRPVNVAFSLYCLFISAWSFCVPFHVMASSAAWSVRWVRILHIGAFLIPVGFIHFVYDFIGIDKLRRQKLTFFYLTSAAFGLLGFTPWMVTDAVPKFGLDYLAVPGPLYLGAVLFFISLVIYGTYLLACVYRQSTGSKRNQMRYLFWGTVIGYAGGVDNFIILYDIKLFPLYPFGTYAITFYVLTTAYAILRHRLMDIEVVIKKTLVFAGLSSFVVACFSIPLFLLPKIFARSLSEASELWLLIVTGMVVAALLGPINAFLVNITDRFLFQKRKEIKIILKNLGERTKTFFSLEEVGRVVLSSLVDAFRLESGMMVIHDRRDEKFRLLENSGVPAEAFVETARGYFNHSDVHEYFESYRSTVSLDNDPSDGVPKSVSDWLNKARGRVCIPLFIDDNQGGFLILGKKRSDQEFSQEEADYFPAIANQVELAIRNACLVETVVQEREAKVKAEHLARRAKFAGLVKHEIKSKLTYIDGPAGQIGMYFVTDLTKLFEEYERKEFLEKEVFKKEFVRICDKIKDASKKINIAVDRVLLIAQTASAGINEGDKSFLELDFRTVWEDAKEESGLKKQCDFESTMPEEFRVFGNYHALQRTFVNLITNAWDAMKGQEEPLIKLRCSYENMAGKRVAYFEFEDSGCGIPKEIQGKIFEEGFSTKPRPDAKDLLSSGYGQGLAACKLYIESIHNGKIWSESEVGKGTTFKLWIPTMVSVATGNEGKENTGH